MKKTSQRKDSWEAHTIDMQIGARLRARRTAMGMTQEALGKALKDQLSHQQIQKYECGENSISCTRLVHLAEVLGVPASYFFEAIEEISYSQLSESEAAYEGEDGQFTALGKVFADLPNTSMRKAVVEFLKIVSDNTKKTG